MIIINSKLVNMRYQAVIMFFVSIICALSVATFYNSGLRILGIALFSLAALGSWFKKGWVQHIFFACSCLIILRVLFLLFGSIKSASHILLTDTYFHIFIAHSFYAVIFFAIGYLAQCFFGRQNILKTHVYLAKPVFAFSIALVSYFVTILIIGLLNSSIEVIPTTETLITHTKVPLGTFFVLKALWPLILIEVIISSMVVILLLAITAKSWTKNHAQLAAFFLPTTFIFVSLIHFFYGYFTKNWSATWFFDGLDIVLALNMGKMLGIYVGGRLALVLKRFL